jgi:hypothetical protein
MKRTRAWLLAIPLALAPVTASACGDTARNRAATMCRSGESLDASVGSVGLCSDPGNNRQSVMLDAGTGEPRELARLILPDYAETTLTVFDESADLYLVQDELMEVDPGEAIVSARSGLVGQLHSRTRPKATPIGGGWLVQWVDARGKPVGARLCERAEPHLEPAAGVTCPESPPARRLALKVDTRG